MLSEIITQEKGGLGKAEGIEENVCAFTFLLK